MPEETIAETAEASLPAKPDGVTPPVEQAPNQAQQDTTKEERARAALRGEPPKDAPLDPDDINNQFDPETGEFLDEDPTETPAEAAPEPEAQVETVETEEEKTAREEAEEAAREAKEKKEGKRNRVRIDKWNDRDRAIATLAKEDGISFSDAEKRLYGDAKPLTEKTEEKSAAPTVDELRAKVTTLRAERDAASESMDMKTVNRLNDEISDLRDQIKDTTLAAQHQQQSEQQTAAQRFTTAEASSTAEAIDRFPDATKEGTPLYDALTAKRAQLLQSNPAFFNDPEWPILLTASVASKLGIAPKNGEAAKPAPKAPVIAPKKVTRHAITPAPGANTSASTANSEAAFKARLSAARAARDGKAVVAIMAELQALNSK